ncbi:hypothetical protein [Planobispora longispora]|uniref:Uncharacterized protein n=1 Tax=Planobispora longispora TaxID=28887 RepID=A0A8J3RUJ6_9ACTN|nr:hypothetical protein [Planobispora longispora]GIH80980.1 hypothetical protein Plo01_74090 [Planobispora longispora]
MTAQPSGADEWRAAWTAALDELEMDVVAAEKLLSSNQPEQGLASGASWSPPEGIGPLPLDMRPRAEAILARQLGTAKAMAQAMVVNRRQAAMLARVESGGNGAPRPVYIDCAA